MPNSAPVIDAEQAAFMQGAVSIAACSCNEQQITSVVRSLGCRVSADRRQVRLFFAAGQAATLLADIARCGAIAVVFSRPTTNRTMQLKGADATICRPAADDFAVVAAHVDDFATEIRPLGFSADFVRALLAHPPHELVAVSFTPTQAFSQTPGSRAGQPLQAGA